MIRERILRDSYIFYILVKNKILLFKQKSFFQVNKILEEFYRRTLVVFSFVPYNKQQVYTICNQQEKIKRMKQYSCNNYSTNNHYSSERVYQMSFQHFSKIKF